MKELSTKRNNISGNERKSKNEASNTYHPAKRTQRKPPQKADREKKSPTCRMEDKVLLLKKGIGLCVTNLVSHKKEHIMSSNKSMIWHIIVLPWRLFYLKSPIQQSQSPPQP